MKKIHFWLLSLLLLSFACSSDDDDKKDGNNYEAEQFYGEWCCIDATGVATDLTLVAHGISGVVYNDIASNPKKYESLTGNWEFFPSNGVLRMSVIHTANNQTVTEDYDVLKLDSYTLQIRNKTYGSVDTYYRVVGSQSMTVGEEASLSLNSVSGVTGYDTSNASIVKVDAKGNLTATGGGIAFVSAITNKGTAMVKVEVSSRVKYFFNELFTTIDDVKKAHGNPNNEGQLNQNMAIVYRQPSFDASLSAVQYQYDAQTREVTRIMAVYTNAQEFSRDRDFIISNYYEQGTNIYGDKPSILDCKCILSPFEKDGSYYVTYGNQEYYIRNSHY